MAIADFKGAAGVDTSNLAARSDKIDIDKLKTVPADLSKLRNVVDNDIVKKTVYDKLVTKTNVIDTSGFVLKTQYRTNKSGLEEKAHGAYKKISDTTGLVKKNRL